jgi:predicted RNA-binding Zn ribbon-like protein
MEGGENPKAFKWVGGHLSLDFNNTVDWKAAEPHAGEYLTDYGRLVAWAGEAGVLSRQTEASLLDHWTAQPSSGDAALHRAWSTRTTIHRIFTGLITGDPPVEPQLDQLNPLVKEAQGHLRYDTARRKLEWDWSSHDGGLLRPVWPVVWAATQLLTAEELIDVKTCANEICGWLFLDTSRKHNRKWCEMGVCGNRAKARRFYDRRKRQPGRS